MDITTQMINDTLTMFAFLAVELTALFLLISYIVGVLQEHIPPEKIQSILSSKNGKGYIVAGFLGAITPFCSCSTIPFLKGLLRAKAGFGTMMVFLFASPLVNPIIIGLFAVTLGVKVAMYYLAIAMSVSILAGYLLEKLGFEKYIKPDVYNKPKGSSGSCSGNNPPVNKWYRIWQSTWGDFVKVLPFLIFGIAVGSVIYGFMPADYVAEKAGGESIWSVPIAAVIGIPLYIRAEAVIPLSAVLATKGMELGTVIALIIGSAGASLTEVILLKSLFKNQMILAFLAVVLSMAMFAGYSYRYFF